MGVHGVSQRYTAGTTTFLCLLLGLPVLLGAAALILAYPLLSIPRAAALSSTA